jgi:hypothetical protein
MSAAPDQPRGTGCWGDAAALLVPLAFYLTTMVPTVQLGDSGELTLGAALLAIPHVPGYPVMNLLGHLVARLPLAHFGWRGNFFSALGGALAAWATYRLLLAMTGRRLAALAAALTFAASMTLWAESIKIRSYPLNTAFAALTLWFAWNWRTTFDRRWLFLAALVFGVGLGNHEILLVVGAVPAVWMIVHRRRLRLTDAVFAAGLVGLGLSTYLYLPLRAWAEPAFNWGDPSNLPRLLDAVLQKQYAGKMLNPDWGAKLEVVRIIAAGFLDEMGPTAFFGAALGLLLVARRDPPLAVGLLLLIAGNVALRINYIGPDEAFQVRRYMISSYLVPAIGLGVALAELETRAARARRWAWPAFGALLACVAVWPIVINFGVNRQAGNWVGYESGQNILSHPEPAYAVFVGGDNDIFPIWYLQIAERRRPTVAALPRAGFYSEWVRQMMGAALPPGTLQTRLEYFRPELADSLLLSTAANLLARGDPPVAFLFDHLASPVGDAELQRLRARAWDVQRGALTWWRDPRPERDLDVWRFYETAAIRDQTVARDHHTENITNNYSVFFDRRVRALEAEGDVSQAIEFCRAALEADADNMAAMGNCANLLSRAGRLDEAIALQRRAIELAPRDWRLHHNLAAMLKAAGRPSEAAAEQAAAERLGDSALTNK